MLYTPEIVQLSKDNTTPKFDKSKFDAAISWVYNQKEYGAEMLEQEPGMNLMRETGNILTDAFNQGIESGVLPPEMESKLRESVFVFSACKTHQELTEVSSLLRTTEGKVKPFEQFSRDVISVHANYNVHYLKAEYQFAVTSSQMAAKWVDVERDGEQYNLQYRTADDANVREAHRVLHNTTLPATDPFWDKYYPPNGWGCRCNIVQVRKSKYETNDSQQAMSDGFAATRQMSGDVDKGAIFRFNPGKSREIFPPKHPYYKMTSEDKTQVKAAVEKTATKQPMVNLTQILSGKTITESDFKNIMTVYAEKYNANYNGGLLDIVVIKQYELKGIIITQRVVENVRDFTADDITNFLNAFHAASKVITYKYYTEDYPTYEYMYVAILPFTVRATKAHVHHFENALKEFAVYSGFQVYFDTEEFCSVTLQDDEDTYLWTCKNTYDYLTQHGFQSLIQEYSLLRQLDI